MERLIGRYDEPLNSDLKRLLNKVTSVQELVPDVTEGGTELFSMEIIDGYLWVHYQDNPPNLSIDESGYLIYTAGNTSVNLGQVQTPGGANPLANIYIDAIIV